MITCRSFGSAAIETPILKESRYNHLPPYMALSTAVPAYEVPELSLSLSLKGCRYNYPRPCSTWLPLLLSPCRRRLTLGSRDWSHTRLSPPRSWPQWTPEDTRTRTPWRCSDTCPCCCTGSRNTRLFLRANTVTVYRAAKPYRLLLYLRVHLPTRPS